MRDCSVRSKVVLAGGNGFLGRLLANAFIQDDWEVIILTRGSGRMSAGTQEVHWDGTSVGPWKESLEGATALINLSGRSVNCRYNRKNKEEILTSRVDSTRSLSIAVESCMDRPRVWINASSMALYGERWGNDPPCTENSSTNGIGFLEEVTRAWEAEFFARSCSEVRQIALRISFVLGRKHGAFPLLAKFARLGLGGAQGSGDQWMSWLHQDDFVRIVRFLIDRKEFSGPINLSSPQPLANRNFMKCLRNRLAPMSIGVPAPAWGVRLGCFLIGSAAELALQSRKVVSAKLEKAGYEFICPTIEDALDRLLLTNKQNQKV